MALLCSDVPQRIEIVRRSRAERARPLQDCLDQALLDTQAVLHLFECVSLGLGVEKHYDEELQHHHRSEKYKGIRPRGFRKLRKRISNDGVHDPVRGTSHALPLCTHAAWKHFAYVDPNHCALRNGEECNVGHEEHEKIALVTISKK